MSIFDMLPNNGGCALLGHWYGFIWQPGTHCVKCGAPNPHPPKNS